MSAPTEPTGQQPARVGEMPLGSRAIVFGLREAGVGVALVLLIVVFSIVAPYFATTDNFSVILGQISINTILAVGMTFVILIGGIDLSVGSVLALTTVIGAAILAPTVMTGIGGFGLDPMVSIPLTIVACLAVGAGCGFINGFVTERWRVPSFIVTLGMMSIARGASQVLSNNSTITGLPKVFKDAGNVRFFDLVPAYFVIAIAVVLISWFVLRYTVFGRFIYAIGNNEEAVRLSGHNPRPFKVTAFIIC
ncbi:MAG TPA: ABC transporter permease, partial [Candidatus Deferrimicrobium sp.]|nr:ABC transporter permease [Candidatus Deferrimicrobium sp.]